MRDSPTSRLWRYQAERFPLYLIVPTTAAVVASSAAIARSNFARAGVAGATVFLFLAHMRLFDEFKDFEHDRVHHPERPFPRGLVSRRELVRVTLVVLALEISFNVALNTRSGRLWFAIALGYSLLAAREFLLSQVLRPRLLLYNAVHFVQLVWVQLYVYATLGPIRPGAARWHFALSLAVLLLLEVARKVRTKEADRAGDTYSAALGHRGAAALYGAIGVVGAFAVAGLVDQMRGPPLILVLPGGALAAVLVAGFFYLRRGDERASERLQTAAVALFIAAHLSVVIALA